MMEAGARPPRRKFWKFLLYTLITGLLVLIGLGWYSTTNSFQELVRARLVRMLERSTGGRVELESFHTSPFRLRIEMRNVTVHGREPAGDVPYAHVDTLIADLKLVSLLGADVGLNSLVLERPVVHVIFFPDGTTNQPPPTGAVSSGKGPVEQLFALSIDRLDVRHGELIWDNQSLPLDFVCKDISADMAYTLLHGRYNVNLLVGKVDTKFDGYKPVSWMFETHFSLGQAGVEISSFKATSGHSHVEASGHVRDLRRPRVELDYKGQLDLGEAAAVARRAEVRRGTLTLDGHGSWSAENYSATGSLELKDLDGHSSFVAVHDAGATSRYALDSQKFSLTQMQGRLWGGSLDGEVQVSNWSGAAHTMPSDRKKASGLQQGTIHLRMNDVSLAEMAAAFSTSAHPLTRLGLGGATDGTVDLRWTGDLKRAEAEVALDITPAHVKAGQLPVTAKIRGKYRGVSEELELTAFDASTPASQVHANGSLSATAALRVSLTTSNLAELQPLLAAAGSRWRIPAVLHGRASFSGTVIGKLFAPTIASTLEAEDFDLIIPASTQAPERLVHWDSLTTGLQLSQHNVSAHSGVLKRGNTEVGFDLSAGLQHGEFVDQSPFTARVDIHRAEVGEILALAGRNLPVSGTVDLHLQASGTKADPKGDGHMEVANGTAYGEAMQRLNTDLHFADGEAQFNNVQLVHSAGAVTGGGAYRPSTGAFRFNLAGTNIDLAGVPGLHDRRVILAGRADFTAQGAGNSSSPQIAANFLLHDLTVDEEKIGNLTLKAETQGRDLHLVGQSQFERGQIGLDGDIHLVGDWDANIGLKFADFDADPVLRRYLTGRVTGPSSITGNAQLRGPLLRPADLTLTADLSDVKVNLANLKLSNSGPVRFSIAGQSLSLEQFHIVGEGTDLSATGTIQLTGEHQLSLRAQGRGNLRLIQSFNRKFTSSGVVTVDMSLSGPVAHPAPQGRLQITNGAIAYIDLPSALSDINGSLIFNQDRLQIEELTAHTGGGNVTFTGYATGYDRQISFDLGLQAQDVRLRYPPGVSSTADANLHLVGTSASTTLSGDVTIKKLSMTPGFDFGSYLARSAASSGLPQTDPLLSKVRLDVHIVTTPELQMQTASIRLSGDADLRLRGTAAKPSLLGRADIIEGEVYFNGTKYRLERGDVSFLDPVKIEPILDLQATTQVRDYDITLNVNGQPDKLSVTYHSEPPLPTADIIALLALGRTRQESAQLQSSSSSPFSSEASNAILTEALNATISNRVQRLFGGSRIKIDPEGLTTETSTLARGPAVTIEQQVADKLTLTYSTNVAQTSQQIIQVEYNVSRNVSVVAVRDQNGVVSFDVKVRRRKK